LSWKPCARCRRATRARRSTPIEERRGVCASEADFFFQTTNPSCGANPCVNPGFAWNHGDYQNEIATTWLGMVGPGSKSQGVDASTWTDHTNVRPAMLSLLGLQDDCQTDGRVLVEGLTGNATPSELRGHGGRVKALGDAYEQITASFRQFATDALQASTTALNEIDDANDLLARAHALATTG
jgi:hypothetical protein